MDAFKVGPPAVKVSPNLQERVKLAYHEMTPAQIEAKKIAALPIGDEFASFPIDSSGISSKSFGTTAEALVSAGPLTPFNKTKVVDQANSFYVKLDGTNKHLIAGPFDTAFVSPI